MKLPLLVAETTATVAPFFWFRFCEDEEGSYLRRRYLLPTRPPIIPS
jgi:hypothetical protein